mmetsp:Transcript_28374/g.81771  ORF Transcript_28374/g.81771 Transcript_28374/m.81771 type:complete len:583 (-) Transcript_28374:435-2183(-)
MSGSEEHVVGVGHIRQPVGMQRHPAAESVVHGDVGVFVVVPPLLGGRDGAVRTGRVVAVTTTHAATIPSEEAHRPVASKLSHIRHYCSRCMSGVGYLCGEVDVVGDERVWPHVAQAVLEHLAVTRCHHRTILWWCGVPVVRRCDHPDGQLAAPQVPPNAEVHGITDDGSALLLIGVDRRAGRQNVSVSEIERCDPQCVGVVHHPLQQLHHLREQFVHGEEAVGLCAHRLPEVIFVCTDVDLVVDERIHRVLDPIVVQLLLCLRRRGRELHSSGRGVVYVRLHHSLRLLEPLVENLVEPHKAVEALPAHKPPLLQGQTLINTHTTTATRRRGRSTSSSRQLSAIVFPMQLEGPADGAGWGRAGGRWRGECACGFGVALVSPQVLQAVPAVQRYQLRGHLFLFWRCGHRAVRPRLSPQTICWRSLESGGGSGLYLLLWWPLGRRARPRSRLVIVADDDLHLVTPPPTTTGRGCSCSSSCCCCCSCCHWRRSTTLRRGHTHSGRRAGERPTTGLALALLRLLRGLHGLVFVSVPPLVFGDLEAGSHWGGAAAGPHLIWLQPSVRQDEVAHNGVEVIPYLHSSGAV